MNNDPNNKSNQRRLARVEKRGTDATKRALADGILPIYVAADIARQSPYIQDRDVAWIRRQLQK